MLSSQKGEIIQENHSHSHPLGNEYSASEHGLAFDYEEDRSSVGNEVISKI